MWTDGDLSFNNKNGKPVDEDGEELEGKIIIDKPRTF
jgi:hypothetical protein